MQIVYLVNELAAELVVLLQHLVPQVTVHALHNIPGLDLEQTACRQSTNMVSDHTPGQGPYNRLYRDRESGY